MTVYVNGVSSRQFAEEVTISDGDQSGSVAHGLGYTPDVKKVHMKPKDGEDLGGDTVTVTTDATNITVNAVNGPFGEDWTFEVYYVLVR